MTLHLCDFIHVRCDEKRSSLRHHLADLLSVAIQEEKESLQFGGFFSGVYCMKVTYGFYTERTN